MAILVSSPEFKKAERIPPKFTGDGEDISPRLEWSNVPEKAKTLVMIMEDPDAPAGTFAHWVIYNIPASSRGLPEDVPDQPRLADGSMQGRNSAGGIGYHGPYPPMGSKHRYYFSLYALDDTLNLGPGASREQVLKALDGHIIDQGRLLGIFQRSPIMPM